ncbi:type II toxin-antitoxin system Phd/YefM family antitoxin [Cyanobium sp. FGCU-6]|nr:type II toxin-antitoxin system Phd/YefM family antitoxin [Cyanobium sp. FGCU6]
MPSPWPSLRRQGSEQTNPTIRLPCADHLVRRRVALAEVKAQLSALLDAVEAGDEVVITRRGKPGARMEHEREASCPGGLRLGGAAARTASRSAGPAGLGGAVAAGSGALNPTPAAPISTPAC